MTLTDPTKNYKNSTYFLGVTFTPEDNVETTFSPLINLTNARFESDGTIMSANSRDGEPCSPLIAGHACTNETTGSS
jgi:hypothetical protein